MDLLTHSFNQLLFLAHSIAPNWGLAIILFSVSLRLVLFPVQLVIIRETRKLQRIEPALKALLEKYRAAPGRYLAESRRLKREAGIRSWLLPLLSLAQLPVLIGVFRAIPKVDALHGAHFLWLNSLSAADPYFVLPLLMGAVLYLQQSRKAAPASASIPAWVIPSVSFAFMAAMPSALVIHSIVSVMLQAGGEWWVNRVA